MYLHACTLLVTMALLTSPTFAQGPALQSPVGQDKWAVGSDHVIRWNPVHVGDNAPIKAELSVDNQKTWSAINTRYYMDAAGGSFRWKIPGSLSGECFVRVINTKTKVSIQNHFPFAIIPSQEVPNYQWTRLLEKAPYAPRDGAGILSFNDKIFIFGGWNPGDKKNFPRICSNEVWNSADGKKWHLVKPNTFLDNSFDADADWEGRHTGGYVIHNDKMWLVGGDVNQGHYQNDVWNSSDGKHWTRVTNNVPWGPRALHSTVAYQEKIWIIGGQTMPAFAESKEAFFSDVWNSSDGVTWQRIVPKKPAWKPRGMISGSVVFKGRIWLLGGGTYDTPTTKARNYYNDVWSTADGESWQRHTESAPWQPRQYQHVAVYENRMWVIGGYHDGDINDVWYSADGENWYRVFGTPWQSRHATSVVAHNGKLWLTLGSCMAPDLWHLKRSDDPGYKAPVEPPLTSLVSIKFDGFTTRKVFIFDSKNPNGSPFGFTTFPNRRVHRPIYSTTFGLNYLDGVGKNAYAEMMITEQGDIEFVKWRDGGANNHIAVDNTTRPPSITIIQE